MKRRALVALLAASLVSAGAIAALSAEQLRESASSRSQDCVGYTLAARKEWQRERVVSPGSSPALSTNAFWAGTSLAGRRAVVSVEAPKQRFHGGPFYSTYYETRSTGCRSSYLATGDQEPPPGEIVVVSDRRSSYLSRTTMRIVNGRNAVKGTRPVWPRFEAALATGERATVIPATGEIAGLGGFRGLIVVLPKTLVRVGGTAFQTGEIELNQNTMRRLAGSLRRLKRS